MRELKMGKKYIALLLTFIMAFSTPVSAVADTLVTNEGDVQTNDIQAEEGHTDDVIHVDDENMESISAADEAKQDVDVVDTLSVEPNISIIPVDDHYRFYQVQVSNYTLPSDGKRMKAAVFPKDNSNKVQWLRLSYNAQNNSYETVFDILNYSEAVGTYTIHVYYESEDDISHFVSSTEFQVTSQPVNTAIVEAEPSDSTEKYYRITVQNFLPVDNGELRIGVWNDSLGTGSTRWITAEQSQDAYIADVKISDYKAAGSFTAHVYCRKSDGSMLWIGGTKFTTTKASSEEIKVMDQNYQNGTADLKVSGIQSPSGINKVEVGIWSAANQGDMVWYEATKSEDGAYHVTMDVSKHKYNFSVYNAHVYVTDGNGIKQFIGGTSIDFTVKFDNATASLNTDNTKALFQIKNLQVPKGAKAVSCAVWSESGNQNDINWIDLSYDRISNSWKGDIAQSKFKSTGKYIVHVYITKQDNSKVFLTGTSYKVAAPSAESISVSTDNDAGKFAVNILGIKSDAGVSSVRTAIWSASDQSDIVWYNAVRQSDGSYSVNSDISKHKYNLGNYSIHVYVKDQNGIMTNVGCKNAVFTYRVGDISLSADEKQMSYPVTVKNVVIPMGASKVEFAAWSEAGGQDDVRWYTGINKGNGTYTANIDVKNHKTAGKYIIHVYATTKGGKKIYLGSNNQMNVDGTARANVAVTGRNDSEGSFTVVVSNLSAPSGISNVRVAAWSTGNQSDVSWYTATKQSDGNYKAVVKVLNHNYNLGNYTIHAYVTMGNQIVSFGAGTTYRFMPDNFIYILKDVGWGKRRVVIKNPTSTSNLRFGVWSDTKGQDDISWYSAGRNADGSWQAIIESRNHRDSGNFSVHAYAGGFLNAATFFFPADEFAKYGWYYENGYKLYYINDVLQKDVSSIIGPQSQYAAKVNRTTCTVTIYAKDGGNGFIIPVKAFACSVGLPQTPTPTGTYNTKAKYRWHELMGPSYGQYCTRIVNGILFHSVAGYNTTSYNLPASEYNKLGQPASHGCVRLNVRDAKWIYDNCRVGMSVTIYDSSYPGPLGKPATIKIPASQNWDPTDPNI